MASGFPSSEKSRNRRTLKCWEIRGLVGPDAIHLHNAGVEEGWVLQGALENLDTLIQKLWIIHQVCRGFSVTGIIYWPKRVVMSVMF